ncbi:acyltransferase family protein [Erwinia sp. HR93]|uniref:acyltransferase family protein n=1 Tax=Erwinia sp. HR93 TaxID=3094840 RepID=UPI002ADECC91|nr:acyltransferase family protein [Erwinia sp. HR93]MEA1065377.1 acyltransferase family protein [Erwinia sp. HR93]
MASQRDPRLDSIKASLMFLVVFGHLLEGIKSTAPLLSQIYDFLYLFHMPAFVFLSGYVIKDNQGVNYRTLVRHIIMPFITLSVFYELLELLINHQFSQYIRSGAPNWILWYLYSLIIWKLLLPIIMRLRFPLCWVLLASFAFSLLHFDGYAFGILRSVIFFPFFIAGNIARENQYFSLTRWITKSYAPAAGVLILIIGYGVSLYLDTGLLYGSVTNASLGYTPLAGIMLRTLYYLAALGCIYAFCALTQAATMLAQMGTRTLVIYGLHGPAVKFAFWPLIPNVHTPWQIIITSVTAILLTWLLSRDVAQKVFNSGTQWTGLLLMPRSYTESGR